MFADSLLESAPHPAQRAAWSKLASVLVQSLALAVVLTVPLFHLERLQFVPPPPSIRVTSVEQPPSVRDQASAASTSTAPVLPHQIVEPKWIPRNIAHITDAAPTGGSNAPGLPCVGDCGSGVLISHIIGTSGFDILKPPTPPPPTKPIRLSEMQLGALIHKVLPEYPIAAKQLGIQGTVVLMATIGKDGRVEHVQPISGPPLLIRPAKIAVEQWQYRPYLLNQEPVVVQSTITVNFVLNR